MAGCGDKSTPHRPQTGNTESLRLDILCTRTQRRQRQEGRRQPPTSAKTGWTACMQIRRAWWTRVGEGCPTQKSRRTPLNNRDLVVKAREVCWRPGWEATKVGWTCGNYGVWRAVCSSETPEIQPPHQTSNMILSFSSVPRNHWFETWGQERHVVLAV